MHLQQKKFFLIGLVLALSLLWPLFNTAYFTHHDDVQVIRLFEMDKCIKDYQIPCRWVPDLGGLYGYPIFNYYAPLPYYYGEIFYLLSGNLIFSAKMMFAASFIGSFVFMYLFSRKFFGELGGSLSAIFYAFAPYHAVDFYVRGAMGEMWGLMFFPAILWGLTNLAESPTITKLITLGILTGGLITAHNLSAMVFFPIALSFAVMLFLKNRNHKFLWFGFFGFALGLLLSAFYLLPMVFEKDLVHVDSTTSGYFSYTEHFKGLRKLFLERSWGWGASVREVPGGERDGLSFQIGLVHLFGWLLALISMKILWRKNPQVAGLILFSTLVSLLSVFMVNPRSEFIWKEVETLKYLQFPWRFLQVIIFFLSFVCGSVFLITKQRKELFWLLLVAAVVLLNFSYFRPEKFIQTSQQELLSGQNWDKQIKRSIFDYLPIFAKEPPAELAVKRYEILTGDLEILDFKEGTNWISFRANAKTHSILRLSQYYFPNWKIFVDQKEAKVEYKNTLGLMTIILGKGSHVVSARLYDTPIRSIANVISLTVAVVILVLLVSQLSGVKKWIWYYQKRIH